MLDLSFSFNVKIFLADLIAELYDDVEIPAPSPRNKIIRLRNRDLFFDTFHFGIQFLLREKKFYVRVMNTVIGQ